MSNEDLLFGSTFAIILLSAAIGIIVALISSLSTIPTGFLIIGIITSMFFIFLSGLAIFSIIEEYPQMIAQWKEKIKDCKQRIKKEKVDDIINNYYRSKYMVKKEKSSKKSKGLRCGEKHGMAKLTDKKVLRIRELSAKKTCRELAEKYEVSYNTIYDILMKRTWKHLLKGNTKKSYA